jgi:hypothetical protein
MLRPLRAKRNAAEPAKASWQLSSADDRTHVQLEPSNPFRVRFTGDWAMAIAPDDARAVRGRLSQLEDQSSGAGLLAEVKRRTILF